MRSLFSGLGIAAFSALYLSAQSLPCKQKTFSVTARAGQELRRPLGNRLELVLDPYKDHQGWTFRISPVGSHDDWTYPVNAPLEGEAQSLGAGWSLLARQRLHGQRRLRFVLNPVDFARCSQLADDALTAPDASAGQRWINQCQIGNLGTILLTNFHLRMQDSTEAVDSATFHVKITVPRSFSPTTGWKPSPCPPTAK